MSAIDPQLFVSSPCNFCKWVILNLYIPPSGVIHRWSFLSWHHQNFFFHIWTRLSNEPPYHVIDFYIMDSVPVMIFILPPGNGVTIQIPVNNACLAPQVIHSPIFYRSQRNLSNPGWWLDPCLAPQVLESPIFYRSPTQSFKSRSMILFSSSSSLIFNFLSLPHAI